MSEGKTRAGMLSLDDLLQANKAQFDSIFSVQMGGGREAATPGGDPAPAAGDATAMLNRRFGRSWSSEVVEHKTERGVVSVLCRLTVDGVSKMQFGSARSSSDAGRSLQRATDDALLRCAAMFAEAPTGVAEHDSSPQASSSSASSSPASRSQASRSQVSSSQATSAADRQRLLPAPAAAPAARRVARGMAVLPGRIDVALRNARDEMELVLSGAAIAPAIRDGYGQAALIADARGRMVVGRFNFAIADFLERHEFSLEQGDVLLVNDPYACGGAVTGLGDWLVLMPVYDDGELVGYTSMRAEMEDVGGSAAGSRSVAATTLFGEGMRIPPIKLIERGELNETALSLVLGNSRTPASNRNDLMALVDGCQAGAARIRELCGRYGRERYAEACEGLLTASNRAMRRLIVASLSEEPHAFEDVIDDDGCGNGPFRLRLTAWREGEQAFFDWTGSAPQAPGPVNFYLNEELFKLSVAMYLIGRSGEAMALNDGISPLISVTLPDGCLLRPTDSAPVGYGIHASARQLEVLGGALTYGAPEAATAASYGSQPSIRFVGVDAADRAYSLEEILLGGLAGRPAGDGIDGHSQWPHRDSTPTEYLERHYPVQVQRRVAVAGSGGAGRHRGGNGVETVFLLRADCTVSLQDDRHTSRPWGLLGGKPGAGSERWLERADGSREALPAKIDAVRVRAGDSLVVRTAGGGGWGDPLDRDPAAVRLDVVRGLLEPEHAREGYGVVLRGAELDMRATEDLRDGMRRNRRTPPLFDFGGRRDTPRAEV